MTEPTIAQKAPLPTDVEEGKTYMWCACGKSSKQPFCDGSHKDSGVSPVKYTAEKTGKVFFCGCKQTNNTRSAMARIQACDVRATVAVGAWRRLK